MTMKYSIGIIHDLKWWQRLRWPWITTKRSDKIIREISEDYENTLVKQADRHVREVHELMEQQRKDVANIRGTGENLEQMLKREQASHAKTTEIRAGLSETLDTLKQTITTFFNELAKSDAGVDAEASFTLGRHIHRFTIYFEPKLARPGGGTWGSDDCKRHHPSMEETTAQVAHERTVLSHLSTKIGLKDWEWIEDDGMFKRTYYDNFLNAPADVVAARETLQGMLSRALEDQTYHEIINYPEE